MPNTRLDAAVERLLIDRRLVSRFRKDPERALARFELATEEVEAIKRGNAEELVGLGLSPAIVWPHPANPAAVQSWLMRNVGRLAPAAILAAIALAWPSSSQAAPARPRKPPGLVRARTVLGQLQLRGRARSARSVINNRYERVTPGPRPRIED